MLLFMLSIFLVAPHANANENERLNLARHYSPIIYQHVDLGGEHSLDGRSDLITHFDYDETWSGDVKWENLASHIGEASVYYSVIETTNHWFIYYAIYHPRDWSNKVEGVAGSLSMHENDMEAMVLMVRIGAGFPGNLVAAMSMSHNAWLEYPIESGIVAKNYDGRTDGDGVSFIHNSPISENGHPPQFISNAHHPRIYIQSRGHGIFMDANQNLILNAGNAMGIDDWDVTGFPRLFDHNGTGVVYYCSSADEGDHIEHVWDKLIDSGDDFFLPRGADDFSNIGKWAKYRLISMDELWNRRHLKKDNTIGEEWMYAEDGNGLDVFWAFESGTTDSLEAFAHPPWSMPDYRTYSNPLNKDHITAPGAIFFNPLSAFPAHFDHLNIDPQEQYVHNPYYNGDVIANIIVNHRFWNGAVLGEIDSSRRHETQGGFLEAEVTVRNTKKFWTKIMHNGDLHETFTITPKNRYAKFGYLPPEGVGQYTIRYYSPVTTEAEFRVDPTLVSGVEATALNLLQIISYMDEGGCQLNISSIDDIRELMALLEKIEILYQAVDLLSKGKAFRAAWTLKDLSSEDYQLDKLSELLVKLGVRISKSALKSILTFRAIYKILVQTMDQVYTFIAENPAGLVYFVGKGPDSVDLEVIANFAADPQSASKNHHVVFDASGSVAQGSPIQSYTWFFGDNQQETTTDPTVSHRFVEEGHYTVMLRIQTSNGETAESEMVISIGNVHEAPDPYFPSSPTLHPVEDGVHPDGVTFTWSESTCDFCEEMSYNLEVHRNGETIFKLDEHEGSLTNHLSYDLPIPLDPNTTYHWAVFATNEYGVWNLEVGDWPGFTTGGGASNAPPVSRFRVTPSAGDVSKVFSADAADSSDPEGGPLHYSWDWGDGGGFSPRSASPSASRQYAAPGAYEITLAVYDNQDKEGRSSKIVHVSPAAGVNSPPTVTVIAGPSGTITTSTPKFQYKGLDEEGPIAGYYRGIGPESLLEENPPAAALFSESEVYTPTLSRGGVYTFSVRAVDEEGALSPAVSRTFTYEEPVVTGGSAEFNKSAPPLLDLRPGEEADLNISFINRSNFDWKAYSGDNNYVELRSVSYNGDPADSWLYPGNGVWLDNSKRRVATQNAPSVAGPTNETAWFIFRVKAPPTSTPGPTPVRVYFRLYSPTLQYFGEIGYVDVRVSGAALSVSGVSDRVDGGDVLSLSAAASGLDASTTQYRHQASHGSFSSPNSAQTAWTAPVFSQMVRATLTVSAYDGYGVAVSRNFDVDIHPPSSGGGNDNAGPGLTFSSPPDGAWLFVGETVAISYAVTDNTGVSHVNIRYRPECANTTYTSIQRLLPPHYNATTWTPSLADISENACIQVIAYDDSVNWTVKTHSVKVVDREGNPGSAPPESPELSHLSARSEDGEYTLRWGPVAGADYYIVRETHNGQSKEMRVDGPASKSFTKTENGKYYYKVKAFNSIGESGWGGPASIMVDIVPNVPPESPHGPTPYDGRTDIPVRNILFRWFSHDPDSRLGPEFRILLGGDPGNMDIIRDFDAPTSLDETCLHPGPLDPDAVYYWRVISRDDDGVEAVGPVWSFTTAPALSFPSPGFLDETAIRLPAVYYDSQSISVVDIDNDGDPDIFEVNDAVVPEAPAAVFYINNGAGVFQERQVGAFPMYMRANGGAWADYDGDGDADVILWFRDRTPRLYRNDGAFQFVEVSAASGVVFSTQPNTKGNTCSWSDIENDGDVDLYCSWEQKLFRNNGSGAFTDVSEASGFSTTATEFPWASAWLDFDKDGDMDLVTAGGADAAFYENLGGGQFDKDAVPLPSGGTYPRDHMGVAVGDYNNDGYPDLFLASNGSGCYSSGAPAYNPDKLLRNRGNGVFEDVTGDSGLPLHLTSQFAATWIDYDNDGFLDLAANHKLFRNMGDGTFQEITGSAGVHLLNTVHGVVGLDANNDGAMDLYYGTLNQNQLFLNESPAQNWIRIDPQGAHPAFYGAEIRISSGEMRLYKTPSRGTGWGDQESPLLHFGVGIHDSVDVRIQWPDGVVDELFDVDVNQRVAVTEGENQDAVGPDPISNLVAVAMSEQSVLLSWTSTGDDGMVRTASEFDIRWSTAPIDEVNWNSAAPAPEAPAPTSPGARQSWEISGLSPDMVYHFAMKVRDEAGNQSALSNVATARTTRGDRILDFSTAVFGPDRIDLSWMVPDVLIASYDIRYSPAMLHEGNFQQATPAPTLPEAGYPGDVQTVHITGLSENTTYYFALKMVFPDGSISPISEVISAKTSSPVDNSLTLLSSMSPSFEYLLDYTPYSSGDFNGDGDPDLVMARRVEINGADQYQAAVHFSDQGVIGETPDVLISTTDPYFAYGQAVAVSDLDNDGADDLIVSHQRDAQTGSKQGKVYIYTGGGSMDATPEFTINGSTPESRMGWAVLGGCDINGDEIDDLIAYEGGVGVLYCFYGSEGGFDPDPDAQFVFDNLYSAYFSAGDFNGDGKTDLLANYGGSSLVLFLNGESGIFATPVVLEPGVGWLYPVIPSVGDFNDDGFDDIVIASDRDVYVYFGAADKNWPAALPSVEIPDVCYGNGTILAMDVDGDGVDDLLVGNVEDLTYYDGVARVYLGGAGFDNVPDKEIAYEGRHDIGEHMIAFGDLNGDGFGDLLLGSEYDSNQILIMAGEPMTERTDSIAPASVTDLTAVSEGVGVVTLRWTAPGDDGAAGKAALYDIILTADYNGFSLVWGKNAGVVTGLTLPSDAGMQEKVRVENLTPGVTYRFALRTWDDAGNVSERSNVAEASVRHGFGFSPRFQFDQVDSASTDCSSNNHLLQAAYNAGDVNGDGVADLLLNGGAECGRVRVFFGGALFDANPDFDIMGSDYIAEDLNGLDTRVDQIWKAYPLMDYTGDGKADFYIRYNGYSSDGFYPGGADLFSVTPSGKLNPEVWKHIEPVGDVNGDGRSDFVSYKTTSVYQQPPLTEVGLFFGGPDFNDSPGLDLYDGSDFMQVRGIGDFNGDGFDDIAIGTGASSYTNNGQVIYYGFPRVYIYLGGASFNPSPAITIQPPSQELGDDLNGWEYAHRFGRGVEGIGDWNGDGYSDLAVSASDSDVASYEQGAVYVYFGGADAPVEPDVMLFGPVGARGVGGYLLSLGDVNQDGYDDFMAWAADLIGENGYTGKLLFKGGPAPSDIAALGVLEDDPDLFDTFINVDEHHAGIDFNNDGKNEIIWRGGRSSPTGTVHLVEIDETDTDGDGVLDNEDPFYNSAPPASIQLTAPADLEKDVAPGGVMRWTAGDPDGEALTYDLHLGTSSDPGLYLSGLADDELDLSPAPLRYNTFYYWKVIAIDGAGQSIESPVQTFVTTPPPIPGAPGSLEASLSGTGIFLTWPLVSDGVTEEIVLERKKPSDVSWSTLMILDGASTQLLDDFNIQPHQQYEYRIAFRNASGQGSYSTIASVASHNQDPEADIPSAIVFDAGAINEMPLYAIDADGDSITWELTTAPDGVSVDESENKLTWLPSANQSGEHMCVIVARDDFGGRTETPLTISVVDRRPPLLTAPGDVRILVDVAPVSVDLGHPVVSDLVSPAMNILVANDAPGAGFEGGETAVTWTAVDESGNTAAAVQKVFVSFEYFRDADNDGYGDPDNGVQAYSQPEGHVSDNTDCDDGSAAVNPDAAEVCNDKDDNCNSDVDEGFATNTYYADVDRDGYGDRQNFIRTCSSTAPDGFVTNNTDCDDNDDNEHPGQTWWKDADGDGYSDGAKDVSSCARPSGYSLASELTATSGDCDDGGANIHPGAAETCNGIDDDCDDQTDEECPPIVITGSASSITSTSTILHGAINPNGSNTMYRFEYGITTYYNYYATYSRAGSNSANISVEEYISSLTPGTEYHFRLIATNIFGTTYGEDATFTTNNIGPGLIYVEPDGVCNDNSPCFQYLQDAIDYGSAGNAINVAVGTYNENIEINKDVTLVIGWDADFSTLDQPEPVILTGP